MTRQPRLALSYTPGMKCPGCGRSGWHVGRMTAECAGCGFTLDMPAASTGGGTFTTSKPTVGWKGVNRV